MAQERVEGQFHTSEWDTEDLAPLSSKYTCRLCDYSTRVPDMIALHLAEHALTRVEAIERWMLMADEAIQWPDREVVE